ncbi:hypothetical protein XENOCAPTIV_006412 [Xenoophorus captivus]|uniref:Uncharacterized protein n=1 Tax=Xenoophorus captivus TaxID=1517983 RepID=A0ABV0RXJ7_9TELE
MKPGVDVMVTFLKFLTERCRSFVPDQSHLRLEFADIETQHQNFFAADLQPTFHKYRKHIQLSAMISIAQAVHAWNLYIIHHLFILFVLRNYIEILHFAS